MEINNNITNQNAQNLVKGETTIVAVHVDGSDINQYKLNNGRVIDESEAVKLVQDGTISGCIVSYKNNEAYIKSAPDGITSNNLASLPRF